MELSAYLAAHPKAALAFSGGVDSAYLLYAAKTAGCDVHAYFIRSPFQPDFELRDAKRLASELDVPFTVEEYDILAHPEVEKNDASRCYHCKRALFARMLALAERDGYSLLWDGTNASDDWNDRPGMRALSELGIASPLRECGLTKARIRELSREAGLFTYSKPAYACLATRIPSGTAISPALLSLVERGETFIASLGFSDFRVRWFGGTARIQLPESQLDRALASREAILSGLREAGFSGALLDLQPRNS